MHPVFTLQLGGETQHQAREAKAAAGQGRRANSRSPTVKLELLWFTEVSVLIQYVQCLLESRLLLLCFLYASSELYNVFQSNSPLFYILLGSRYQRRCVVSVFRMRCLGNLRVTLSQVQAHAKTPERPCVPSDGPKGRVASSSSLVLASSTDSPYLRMYDRQSIFARHASIADESV